MGRSSGVIALGPVRIGVISTICGNKTAIRILEQIAHPPGNENSLCNRRVFGPWEEKNGIKVCRGAVHSNRGWTFQVTLGVYDSERSGREGLKLEDAPGRIRSLKSRNLLLRVGEGLTPKDVRHLANMISACCVVLGFGWTNRDGVVVPLPYGHDGPPARKSRELPVSDGSGSFVACSCGRVHHRRFVNGQPVVDTGWY